MNLGVGYTRWFMGHACLLFNSSNPSATWSPAFKGLKAMLAYKSLMFDNNLNYQLFETFWRDWTVLGKSLQIAFFDANLLYGYKHLYPNAGIEPGCLSAPVASNMLDHCRMTYAWEPNNYQPAQHGADRFYYRRIANPMY